MIDFIIKLPIFLVTWLFFTYIIPIFSICGYFLCINQHIWDDSSFIIQKILNVKIIMLNNNKIINNGIILTNHRSFADCVIDPYIFKCPGIGRWMALAASGIFGLFSLFFNRAIVINRNLTRNEIYNKIKISSLYYFYPEGTRCSHVQLPDNYKNIDLKMGLLKSIFEDTQNKCIQIIIHKNKENILNEKKLIIGVGVNLYYNINEACIYTRDYDTFDSFIDKIKLEWFKSWNEIITYENQTISS